ncbi:1,4-alpha-glucan-branching enzyme 3, chloroplastic/amyloplastic-like [Thalictrum thalictroides]|uniref:1,4-alpha-glucan-branching enzyme 3, chloroplastic/amyloplastic-like n=1 Tax=Thalictrum thalictroides TaxID=46969 RepID=A0A7J6XFF1_THATH|nr:1,4-alpha-glucan-branching enzyme 3, chloroplastic/amyloplastic-like [Thalictrum thalictroides]
MLSQAPPERRWAVKLKHTAAPTENNVILNTDEIKYGGQGNLQHEKYVQRTISKRVDGFRNCLKMTLPSRSAQVYKLTRILRI